MKGCDSQYCIIEKTHGVCHGGNCSCISSMSSENRRLLRRKIWLLEQRIKELEGINVLHNP